MTELIRAVSLQTAGGAQQHSRGSQVPLPPEAEGDNSRGPVVVVGHASIGDSCFNYINVEGRHCMALVDSGSTVTLLRAHVVPGGTELEPTGVQLHTITGELAPLMAKVSVMLVVRGWSVRHRVWIATVQEPCILGLDFLKATGCRLYFGEGVVSSCEGPVVAMAPINPPARPPVRRGYHRDCIQPHPPFVPFPGDTRSGGFPRCRHHREPPPPTTPPPIPVAGVPDRE